MTPEGAQSRWKPPLDSPSDVVDFLVVGAQKSATTWLRHMLRQHPQVYMPGREIHFFNKRENFERGLGWYEDYFEGARPDQLRGEKTPNYLWVNCPEGGTDAPGSHERIAACLPGVRVIVLLRDPVERAISAYNHHLCKGRFPPYASMGEAVFGRYRDVAERHGVLSMGRYSVQLAAYLDVIDATRLLVLEFEEAVQRRPEEALRQVCDFLGIDPDFPFDGLTERRNVRQESALEVWARYGLPPRIANAFGITRRFLPQMKRTPEPETRERLVDEYRTDVAGLRRLLDRSFEAWQV